jgi:hypothetical protein
LLPVLLVAILPAHPALGQGDAARQQEVEMAFDHYTSAKTEDQRVAIIDYLQHYESKMVAGALVDHIIADRMATTPDAVSKGKLVVALRHCQGPDVLHGLIGSLSDKRSVPFEAHGAHPRRVCDLAYDELFLKLRTDQRYNLDPSPRMTGIITEHTPVKSRDALIAKLQSLIAKYPVPTPSPSPVAHPEAGPATQL